MSQTTRSAWAPPTNAPKTRSSAPNRPSPSIEAAVLPIADPIASPIPTANRMTARTRNARSGGVHRGERLLEARQDQQGEPAADERADQADELGEGP